MGLGHHALLILWQVQTTLKIFSRRDFCGLDVGISFLLGLKKEIFRKVAYEGEWELAEVKCPVH